MTTEEPGSSSPFQRRGFVAAGIVVAVIVVLGIFVLIATLVSPPGTSPTSAPTNGPGPSAGDESVCGLEGFETTSSLDDAPDVRWELVGTVAAPTDPDVGPGIVERDGFRSCFAHTAEGALFAAVNFLALGTDATTGPRLIELVAPGPGRDALQEAGSGGGPSSFRAQIAGYAISNYSADAVTVDLALNYSTGDLVSLPLKLVWVEGDWKLQMTDEGKLPLAPAPISNLGGYTPWSGA